NIGNSWAYADLEAEMAKSDLQTEEQETTTADRGLEIQTILQSIESHIASQTADVEVAIGREGIRKALVRYLRRYDSQIDLQVQIEDGGFPSEASTLDLLERVDVMLERWARQDKSRSETASNNLRE
ncbi:MAG: hypothetical protein Q9169_008199, partial [Polycauliona sp. 2 TL-2023]